MAITEFPIETTVVDINSVATNVSLAEAYKDAAALSASEAADSEAYVQSVEDSLPEWVGAWATSTLYEVGNLAREDGTTYICVTEHTSDTFSTDLSSGYWEVFAQKGAAGTGTGDMLAANNLSDVADPEAALSNIGGQPLDTNLTTIGKYTYDDLSDLQANAISGGDGTIHTTRKEGFSYVEDSADPDVTFNGVGLVVPAPVAKISAFGDDSDALQSALSWAHRAGGTLIQDNDVTVTTNVLHGNLKVVAGGGSWVIHADGDFIINGGGVFGSGAGAWADEAAILTRSANGNVIFGDANTTQYEVHIGAGVKIYHNISDGCTVRHPWRLIGMKEGSTFYADVYVTSDDTVVEASTVDFYFYNRVKVGGYHYINKGDESIAGGLWIRDINLGSYGQDYGSEFFLDGVECVANGVDEAIGIYTTTTTEGFLRCTGSCIGVKYGGGGIGVSILNNMDQPESEFSVSLDSVYARASLEDGQAAIKMRKVAAQIGNAVAIVTDAQTRTAAMAAIKTEYDGTVQGVPKIGVAEVIFDGAFTSGDNAVDGVYGNIDVGSASVRVMDGSSTPRYSVANNIVGCIRGGEISRGDTATAYRSCVHNTNIYGAVVDCPDIFGITQVIDTDEDTSIMVLDSTTGFTDENRARYHADVIASGTSSAPQVVASAATGLNLDVDYHLDCDGAGGEPPADSFVNTPRPYNVTYRSGGAFELKTRKSGVVTAKTTDASGYTNITHGLIKEPTYFTAYSSDSPAYVVTPTNLAASSGEAVRVRVYDVTTGAPVASTPMNIVWSAEV